MSDEFLQYSPTLDNYWRSIILFGRNVASHKFALAKSLLEFREHGNDLITLEELAEPFSRNLCSHLAAAPKQATSLDLSRNCAAPLTAYYALKENTHGKQTNSRI